MSSALDAEVTIAVITWNSARHLPQLFSSIVAGVEGVRRHRLVVADNGSSDDTVALVHQLAPDASVIQLGFNAGYAAGINAVLDVTGATGPVLVLNPDIRLRPQCVSLLLRALDVPGVGIVAPRLVHSDGSLAHSLRREPTVLRALGEALLGGMRAGRFSVFGEVIVDRRRYAAAGSADWATGAALLISQECLNAVGRFDESYFLYSEEVDFALRAGDAGFTLHYLPDAVAVHQGGDSSTSPDLYALLIANRLRLFARRHGAGRTLAFRAALVVGEVVRAVKGEATHRAALKALLS